MTYQKEFPDFVLDVQLPEGFEDTSWHNNICPSFKRGDVEIFVDYADTALRELPDSPRFSVQRFDAKADAYEDVIQTDDWQTVLDTVAKL